MEKEKVEAVSKFANWYSPILSDIQELEENEEQEDKQEDEQEDEQEEKMEEEGRC